MCTQGLDSSERIIIKITNRQLKWPRVSPRTSDTWGKAKRTGAPQFGESMAVNNKLSYLKVLKRPVKDFTNFLCFLFGKCALNSRILLYLPNESWTNHKENSNTEKMLFQHTPYSQDQSNQIYSQLWYKLERKGFWDLWNPQLDL